MVAVKTFSGYRLRVPEFMLRRIYQAGFLLFCFQLFLPQTAPAKVIEQLIVVIDGEPYTLSNLAAMRRQRWVGNFSGD